MYKIYNSKILAIGLASFVAFLPNINPVQSQDQFDRSTQGPDGSTAESKDKEGAKKNVDPCESKVESVSKGTVASVGNFGSAGATVDSVANGGAPGESVSAMSGSIQRKSDTKCEAVLTNKSECFKYTVSFEIHSSKKSGSFVTSNSVSLSPGASRSVPFSCKNDLNYSLKITKSASSKSK